MIRKALIAVALLPRGCAQVPMADPQADQMAKAFPPPEPGRGALYVYRSGVMGFARPIDVAIVGGATAQLAYQHLLSASKARRARSRSTARSATRPAPARSRSARAARAMSRCR